ncbi:4'-phosphopantetheinyl transferase superfamily protein [Flavobacterium sp.]|uniref:4'-phosphopantetheinyl transferase family protein n=1 Tax=Flavobacterium sp. TaxID=239 RepID=UPI00326732D4
MIGNDVVDLWQTRHESNWQRKGFLEKLFTNQEQLLINHHSDPEIMVWLLWSMKEAVYKIYNRETKIRAYIPKNLVCSNISFLNNNSIHGQVNCNENRYYTKSYLDNDYIHTIATNTPGDLNNAVEIENKNIKKDEYGIPYLQMLPDKLHDVSISHHGRFEKVVTILKASKLK